MKAGILLVEDDHFMAKLVKRHLEKAGHLVTHCTDGREASGLFNRQAFDLCLLDVIMPGKDGFTLAQEIRSKDEHIPIIFTTSRYLEQDRINGFEVGGDDYVVKPFNMLELECRMDVFLRRTRLSKGSKQLKYSIGKLAFYYTDLRIIHEETHKTINLPPREADLLKYLCENSHRQLQRDEILQEVWGNDDFFAGRSMDVYLTRLRKHFKLDPDLKLETFHGKGLKLSWKGAICENIRVS
ncbi:response regulator transcription factor [Chitinophaga pendula]|uniref:response regulator transcription factor n=1 Tax=Chitinophaga TaxID=79328 RepID=UPI000BAEC33B|nr:MULTISPECIES: response regulator transcription factor [Chitinophaga]ASZ11337.1 DNA-binding response regulator [Chitinophaga sp. MD30]UCJ05661.1 response regulator transcription factor [Chitinophaga pendula]